ncbi:MAG: hypothetical protein WCD79_05185 [Chthoniobacteraceae bacterium]
MKTNHSYDRIRCYDHDRAVPAHAGNKQAGNSAGGWMAIPINF